MSDFDTTFAPLFQPALQAVPVLHRPSAQQFAAVRRAGQPALLTGLAEGWPVFERFRDVEHLCARAGAERVFYRDTNASINVRTYFEQYVETSFGEFVRDVFAHPDAGKYLTQGALMRPHGWRQAFERSAYPALLTALAEDLPDLPYYRREHIHEANLWLGPGGQKSGLHFDEFDNFNCAIIGRKRWILFPQSEHRHILAAGGFRDSIARGYHEGEEARFDDPARRNARGFECVTEPGQVLFVPAGWWHQVFSGPELNLSVNYWFLPPEHLLQTAWLFTRRRAGYGSKARLMLAGGVVCLLGLKRLAQYGVLKLLGKANLSPPPTGPVNYQMRSLRPGR